MPKVVPEYKEHAKKRIIIEALKVFSEKGYYRTKMKDIADKLEVSKSAIYQYFKTKEDLLIATFNYRIQQRQEALLSLLGHDFEILATSEFFEKLYAKVTDSPRFSYDFIHEAAYNDSFREKLKTHFEHSVEKLAEFFDKQKKRGIIRKEVDSEALSSSFLALRDGLNSLAFYGLDKSKIKKAWINTMNLIIQDALEK
ncbi:MAG: TetR/AcrR family transcriptional regulator [Candidatus Hodarchaeota archaeon]